ncbi:MAG: hypothetical protein R2883_03075 [Caldisericia bacterium]
MRYIPEGKPQYEKLPTVFLNWDEMSTKLRSDKFSGYIEISGKDDVGFILFSEGRISGSLYTSETEEDLRGQKALSKITMTIQERKGTLSIYSCTPEVCELIAWYIQGNRLYTPMESVFINWEKFLGVMKEKKITGFIRIANLVYTEFIRLDEGEIKGHFIGGNEGFSAETNELTSVLSGKDAEIEVFLKADPSSVVSKLEPTHVTKKPEPEKAEPFKPEKPDPVTFEKEPFIPKTEPTRPTKEVKPISRPEPTPPVEEKEPLIPPDEIPDPFAQMEKEGAVPFDGFSKMGLDKKEEPKPEPVKEEDTFAIPEKKVDFETPEEEKKSRKTPTAGGQTMVAKPSGRIAFLLDGIRKVAQSNIGDDILPWLDGQINRIQSVNPKLTKHDLNLLVDEVERYVRQVRQNPGKATKLASQLKHIIDSFASDL